MSDAPPLTDEEIDLVRVTFWELARRPQVPVMFYDRLFEIAPRVRPMFPNDLSEQGTKLMSMLGAVVAQLHDHATLLPIVHDLGRRHAGYGARPADYDDVGAALLWTFARNLDGRFTPEAEAAWRRAYAALAAAMLSPPAR